MISIYEVIASNKKEAEELLKKNNSYVKFNDEDLPYVLISDDDDSVGDYVVTEARLTPLGEIEIYLPDYCDGEWLPGNYALSMSIDEVYQAIGNQLG